MRSKRETESPEVPLLPRFPSAAYDVIATFEDGSTEIIKVMARGKGAALQTACYTVTKWPDEKIPTIISLGFK